MSPIKDFYFGEEVFITGASGFIGKVLLEKILRTCCGVKTVYLLMRAKKGQTPKDRIKFLTDNNYFSKLKAEQPGAVEKIKVIEGDSKELRLGMSDSDFEKVKSCSMIFHLAASVRFDDHLKDAILLNTRGAREVCELAKNMPNLKVLMHVSTAYVQPLNLHVVEELIDVDSNWRDYIKMAEKLPTEILDAMTMKLTNYAPNTYTYTKLLAEHICNDYRDEYDLPIVIYRPSIVAYVDHEPIPGWSESLSGYNGIMASYHAGLKRVHVGDSPLELVPVDHCVKGMIIASERNKKGSARSADPIPVFNAAAVRSFSMRDVEDATQHLTDHFFDRAIGTPWMVIVPNNFIASFLRFLLQIVPAMFFDALLVLFKRKPMILKLQRILIYSENAVEHFLKNEFVFDHCKFNDLGANLAEDDKEDFSLVPRLPLLQYIIQSYMVTKEVVCNETAESAARARKKTPYWRALGWLIQSCFLFVAYKVLFYFCDVVKNYLF